MYRFHLISPEAILLNLLMSIPVAAGLLAGFGVLVCAPVAPPLAALCGGVCAASLAVLEWEINFAGRCLPLDTWTPGPAGWWVLGSYAGWAAWTSLPRLRPPRRWLAALIAAWTALSLAPPDHGFPKPKAESRKPAPLSAFGFPLSALSGAPAAQLSCTFIAVGHGVSVLVELPDGRTLLYDAGGLGPPTRNAQAIAAVLWSRGLRHVDAVIISHADVDHYNALPELLKRFSVGVAYVSPTMFEDQTPALAALREAIHQARVPLKTLARGDRLAAGEGVLAEVLHPPGSGERNAASQTKAESRKSQAGSPFRIPLSALSGSSPSAPRSPLLGDNAHSIVLHLEALGRRVLLTGDLEGPPLEELLEEEPIDYDLILAPHHGSRRSHRPELAAWATPEVTVISGGRNDVFEEVQQSYRAAGSRVFHTAQDGAVRVTLRRQGVHVQTWRKLR